MQWLQMTGVLCVSEVLCAVHLRLVLENPALNETNEPTKFADRVNHSQDSASFINFRLNDHECTILVLGFLHIKT